MQLLINIDVPDLPAAEALYARAFGLTAARRFGDGGVELLGAQAPIYLLLAAPGTAGARVSAAGKAASSAIGATSQPFAHAAVRPVDRAIPRARAVSRLESGP